MSVNRSERPSAAPRRSATSALIESVGIAFDGSPERDHRYRAKGGLLSSHRKQSGRVIIQAVRQVREAQRFPLV